MDVPLYRSFGALATRLPALATLTAAHMVSPPAWLPYLALSRSAGLRPASTGALVVGGCALHALSTVVAAAGLAAAGGVAGALLGGAVPRLGAAAALGAVGVWLVYGALVRGDSGLPGCCEEGTPAGCGKVPTSPPPAGDAKAAAASAGAPGADGPSAEATAAAGPAPAAGSRAGLALLAAAALTPCVCAQPLLVGLVASSPDMGRVPALATAGVVIWVVSTVVVGAAVTLGGGLARHLGLGGSRLRVAERVLFGVVLLVLAVVTATGGEHAHHDHGGSMAGGEVDAAMHAHHHHHDGMAGMGCSMHKAEVHAHHEL